MMQALTEYEEDIRQSLLWERVYDRFLFELQKMMETAEEVMEDDYSEVAIWHSLVETFKEEEFGFVAGSLAVLVLENARGGDVRNYDTVHGGVHNEHDGASSHQ